MDRRADFVGPTPRVLPLRSPPAWLLRCVRTDPARLLAALDASKRDGTAGGAAPSDTSGRSRGAEGWRVGARGGSAFTPTERADKPLLAGSDSPDGRGDLEAAPPC